MTCAICHKCKEANGSEHFYYGKDLSIVAGTNKFNIQQFAQNLQLLYALTIAHAHESFVPTALFCRLLAPVHFLCVGLEL